MTNKSVFLVAIFALILSLLNTGAVIIFCDKVTKFMEAQTTFNQHMIDWGQEMVTK